MSWRSWIVERPLWLAALFGEHVSDPRVVPPRRILVLQTGDYGDVLTTTPIFQALKTRFPSSKIAAGIGRWARPVLEENPFVDEVVELDVPWRNKYVNDQSWRSVIRFLISSEQISAARIGPGYDLGIDVYGSHVGTALMMRLKVHYRVGLRGYRGYAAGCQKFVEFSQTTHWSRSALLQAQLVGVSELPDARPQIYLNASERAEAARIWTSIHGCTGPRIIVGCGGGHEEKCWPAELWGPALRFISNVITSEFRAPAICLVGAASDCERAAKITALGIPGLVSLCGQTPLRITYALTEQSDLAITNASMLLHVAAAFSRPNVAILGGMFPDQFGHDSAWGYPAPYSSVGPKSFEKWPSIEAVAEAILNSARMHIVHRDSGSRI